MSRPKASRHRALHWMLLLLLAAVCMGGGALLLLRLVEYPAVAAALSTMTTLYIAVVNTQRLIDGRGHDKLHDPTVERTPVRRLEPLTWTPASTHWSAKDIRLVWPALSQPELPVQRLLPLDPEQTGPEQSS